MREGRETNTSLYLRLSVYRQKSKSDEFLAWRLNIFYRRIFLPYKLIFYEFAISTISTLNSICALKELSHKINAPGLCNQAFADY